MCLFAASASAQPKGNARINGKILDDQGKPAQAVVVRAVKAGDPQVMEAKTNDKGEWTMNGLTTGQWNFEFVKDGFDSQRMTVEVAGEPQSADRHEADEGAPAVDPNVELQAEMQKAVELQKAGKLPEARKVIEDLIAKYPAAYRLNAFVATTYESEKNFDKAIEHMKIVVEKEPADIDMKMFLAELYTQKGGRDEAQKILAGIDMTQVKDPTLFINMAIGAINAGKADDAIATLDMVAKQFPTQANVLYYRARAYIVGQEDGRGQGGSREVRRRWRHLMRVSCRMQRSFSNSSRRSSKASLAVALRHRDGARRVRWLWRRRRHHAAAARRRRFAGCLHRDRPPRLTVRTSSLPGRRQRAISPAARRSESTAIRAGGCSTRCGSTSPAPIASAVPTALTGGRNAIDIGEIAVVQDEGDLIESPNAYDLRNLGLRFTRNGAGGYDVRRIDGGFRTTLGTRLTLTDDDSVALNVRVRLPLLRAARRRPRSSTPTATSPSKSKTAPAPTATWRGCSPDRRASRRSSPTSIRAPAAACSETPPPISTP